MWNRAFPFFTAHTPAKFGLPSAVRGAGAARVTLPLASRGNPGVGRFGHWAVRETAVTQKIVASLHICFSLLLPPRPSIQPCLTTWAEASGLGRRTLECGHHRAQCIQTGFRAV